jgi:hypothetical protein
MKTVGQFIKELKKLDKRKPIKVGHWTRDGYGWWHAWCEPEAMDSTEGGVYIEPDEEYEK